MKRKSKTNALSKVKSSGSYEKAIEEIAKKNYENALQLLEKSMEEDPSKVDAQLEYGRTLALSGKRKLALLRLNDLIANAKKRADREKFSEERDRYSEIFYTNGVFQQYQNGMNHHQLEQYAQAESAFEKALQGEPDNVLVLLSYGRALLINDKPAEALKQFELAYSLNEGSVPARTELAERLLASDPSRALSIIHGAQASKSSERALIVEARALHLQGDTKVATDLLLQRLTKNQEGFYVFFWLGKFYASEKIGYWNARKFLMTFQRRTDWISATDAEDQRKGSLTNLELRALKTARAEADELLLKINKNLE